MSYALKLLRARAADVEKELRELKDEMSELKRRCPSVDWQNAVTSCDEELMDLYESIQKLEQ